MVINVYRLLRWSQLVLEYVLLLEHEERVLDKSTLDYVDQISIDQMDVGQSDVDQSGVDQGNQSGVDMDCVCNWVLDDDDGDDKAMVVHNLLLAIVVNTLILALVLHTILLALVVHNMGLLFVRLPFVVVIVRIQALLSVHL